MSEVNPFEPQHDPAHQGTGLPPRSLPVAVTIIAVICLVMGLLNLFGLCFTIPALFPEAMSSLQPNEEAKEIAREAASAQFLGNIANLIFGLIFVPLMVVSAIGTLLSKQWGRSLLVVSLIGFVVWGIIGICNIIYMLVFQGDLMLAQAKAGTQGPQPLSDEALVGIMTGTMIALVVVIFLFLTFYAFAIFYLKKSDVVDYFESAK